MELSSNWLKLQATLKHVSPKSKNRRSSLFIETQNNPAIKRRRLSANSHRTSTSKTSSDTKSMNSVFTEDSNISKKTSNPGILSQTFSSLSLWAHENDISASDLAEAYGGKLQKNMTVISDVINGGLQDKVEIGKYVGIDCEMVGVGTKDRSVLARVSIVNFHGVQVYDSFVKPIEFVTNWRTEISGVSANSMKTAREFKEVQKNVASILKDRIVVGHALWNDFKVMQLSHPRRDIRDTSLFSGFQQFSSGRPGLKLLADKVLGVEIQNGRHSSIEDARATMFIFRRYKSALEAEHIQRFSTKKAMPRSMSKAKPNNKSKSKSKVKSTVSSNKH
ncbi:RNA exonuclease 4 [Erysiphe neolycopersici]|uniref:RNA exonuclease 4 n=1 Tax=Erysiphe neolycopersici TaxID=212602 RepID=A0A420I5U1_9PEZI|nr:RNA exonuclease 4 [Erysiphe neolycopersici]